MTAAAPWSVKGIDPKAREVAKELARRSGMTLGEWLNRVILEDDLPEEIASEDQFGARWRRAEYETPKSQMPTPPIISRPDELGRIAFALDRLTDRIEASETRTGLAISGVEHSVRHAMARIETAEREHMAVATRFDAAAERLEVEQARAAERLRHVEDEAGPRSAEAIALLEARISRVDAEPAPDPALLIEEVVARLGQRLADAEGRTGDALESLRGSLAELDARLRATGGDARPDLERRMEALAHDLTARVEAARSEIADRLSAGGAGKLEARLDRMVDEIAAGEQRSARAIETMGREVLTMAQTLNRRVQSAEQRSAQAIEQVGGEIARIAGAVENRLGRVDQLHAEALERLGAEIGRITERLTDRIIQSERRAAQAIDDVGEQVAAVTERIEQRHERAASDLAERLRQSEERTARLLADAPVQLEGGTAAHAATPDPEVTPPEVADLEADHLEAGHLEAGHLENVGLEDLDIEQQAAESVTFAAAPEAAAEAEAEVLAVADAPLPAGMFGPALFLRAEPMIPPVLDPANPAFGAEDFEAADGFMDLSEGEESFAPLEERDDEAEPPRNRVNSDAPPVEKQSSTLSTREVIEQARAAARAAAGARAPQIHAGDRRARPVRGGLFNALMPGRPASTWQTALMVAGGAAFLSVGAAGVVLMEGPGVPRETAGYVIDPRAALALTPQPAAPPPAAVNAPDVQAAVDPDSTPIADPAAAEFVAVTRAIDQKQPGALARLKTLADGGHAPAQSYLARLYETGHAGVVLNLVEARRWMSRAAEAGDPTAMHNLALYYFRGEGGPADAAAAAQWFR